VGGGGGESHSSTYFLSVSAREEEDHEPPNFHLLQRGEFRISTMGEGEIFPIPSRRKVGKRENRDSTSLGRHMKGRGRKRGGNGLIIIPFCGGIRGRG